MTLPRTPLELAIELHRKMQPALNEDNQWQLCLPDDIDFSTTLGLLDQYNMRGTQDDEQSRTLSFSNPLNFYNTLPSFLASAKRRVSVPAKFYIADLNYAHPGDELKQPEKIKSYLSAVELFQGLEFVADDVRTMGEEKTLVFLGARKLEITSEFKSEHLHELDGLQKFKEEFLSSTIHTEQKKSIISQALLNLFTDKKVDFSELLSRFRDFSREVEASYQCFVSEFSFEKIKTEVEQEKLEFITRLNSIFSDIQNQLLAIPAALILIGGQMKDENSYTLSNSLILLGAFAFAVLMNLLIRNQSNTLKAIESEIDRQGKLIRGAHKIIASEFAGSFKELTDRSRHQRWLLRTVSFMVALSLFLSTYLFIRYSNSFDLWIMLANLTKGFWG